MSKIAISITPATHDMISQITAKYPSRSHLFPCDSSPVPLESLDGYFKPQGCLLYRMSTNPLLEPIAKLQEKLMKRRAVIFFEESMYYMDNTSHYLVPLTVTDKNQTAILKLKQAGSKLKVDDIHLAKSQELRFITTAIDDPEYHFSAEDKKLKIENEKICAAVLNDTYLTWNAALKKPLEQSKEITNRKNRTLFWILAGAGVLLFGAEGFDGISSIFGLFSISSAISAIVGLVFSCLAVTVFWAFDLEQIAEHLNVNVKSASSLVDYYLKQLYEMEQLFHAIDSSLNEENTARTPEDVSDCLASNRHLLYLLAERLKYLALEKITFDVARKESWLRVRKNSVAVLAGAIFFSGGFFTGQAVALSVAGIFMASVSVAFPPVLAAACLLGVLAFILYWFVQKPGIENLIGRKLGLDDEKLEEMGEPRINTMLSKINSLGTQVVRQETILEQEKQLLAQGEQIKQLAEQITVQAPLIRRDAAPSPRVLGEGKNEGNYLEAGLGANAVTKPLSAPKSLIAGAGLDFFSSKKSEAVTPQVSPQDAALPEASKGDQDIFNRFAFP